jgi:hypothetical protein
LTCAWILLRPPLPHSYHSIPPNSPISNTTAHSIAFFSQGRRNLDDLGRCVFQLLLPFCAEVLVRAVADTLARKSGVHILGRPHHDSCAPTQKRPFFAFGHNFVVFSLSVCIASARPTSSRPAKAQDWCASKPARPPPSNTAPVPELALELIQMGASWIPHRMLRVLSNSEYAGQTISRHLPTNATLISSMNMKAASMK